MRAFSILRAGGGAPTTLTAVASPDSVSGSGETSTITTDASTCTATFGASPYTYAWEWVSNPDSLTIVSATSASTIFRKAGSSAGATYAGIARCKVTDNVGAIAYSNNVDVNLVRL